MISVETMLDVADNSGAKKVQCIKVLGGTHRKTASLGDIIVVSVKSVISKGAKVEKGSVNRAVIVRVAKEVRREDGTYVKFDTNAVCLLNKQNELIGTRIPGPVARELRAKNFSRILSLASEVA